MKTYLLAEDLRNYLIDYLGTKPWREVDQIIKALADLHVREAQSQVKPPSNGPHD